MKKLSKRTKIILSIISLVLIISLGVGIALSLLSYKDPIDQAPEVAPLGDYDYSKRPFIASYEPTTYKGDIYFLDPARRLSHVSLLDLSCDIRTETEWEYPKNFAVCTNDSHDHGSVDEPDGCYDYEVGQFLIDAYESNGGSPIIYRTRVLDGSVSAEDEYGVIVRYDTGSLTGETLVSVSDAIDDVMTYDQWLFFTTLNAKGVYILNVIAKTGGDITSLELGKHGWNLMWANDDYIYYQDSAGNVYRATLDLQNPEFIYYAETISVMEPNHIGTFIHGDYLYFESDYETVPYPMSVDGSMVLNWSKHSIRRVPLDNLYGESELVAENVLDCYVFGVGNNVLYYQPCIMGEGDKQGIDYYFPFTGGQLMGVDLDTLEPAEIVNDIGLDLDGYAIGNVLYVRGFPTDSRYTYDRYAGWGTTMLILDTRTGAVYPFSINMYYS